MTNVYIFHLRQHSNRPLRKHRLSSVGLQGKPTSVGCNWLILIHVVDFIRRQGFSQKGVQQSHECPFLEEIQGIYSINFL